VLAGELADARGRLDALGTGDTATDVRAVFSWSYRYLSPAAARMFRLLGLHPGPDITVDAAASLAAVPAGQARGLLDELAVANLLAEHASGRFACHDLLRAYAGEQARVIDSEEQRRGALTGLFDYYLAAAAAAMDALFPGENHRRRRHTGRPGRLRRCPPRPRPGTGWMPNGPAWWPPPHTWPPTAAGPATPSRCPRSCTATSRPAPTCRTAGRSTLPSCGPPG
jgi:hypothetical protein